MQLVFIMCRPSTISSVPCFSLPENQSCDGKKPIWYPRSKNPKIWNHWTKPQCTDKLFRGLFHGQRHHLLLLNWLLPGRAVVFILSYWLIGVYIYTWPPRQDNTCMQWPGWNLWFTMYQEINGWTILAPYSFLLVLLFIRIRRGSLVGRKTLAVLIPHHL